MPILTGQKVMLRPYRSADAAHIPAWANDPATTQFLSTIFWFPYTEEMSQGFVGEMTKPGRDRAAFVMADPDTGEYWGQLDLLSIDWQYRRAEVGIVLALADKRGRGIGTEALRLLCGYAFGTLGLHRLELSVHGDNARALRCYEKAGFRREGLRRGLVYKQGRWVDLIELGMLDTDWEKERNNDV